MSLLTIYLIGALVSVSFFCVICHMSKDTHFGLAVLFGLIWPITVPVFIYSCIRAYNDQRG